jgi:hypothetical protein
MREEDCVEPHTQGPMLLPRSPAAHTRPPSVSTSPS